MYPHQAIVHPDMKEFLKSIVKQVNTHQKCKHWQVVSIKSIVVGIEILDSVWTMHMKRNIVVSEVSKNKAKIFAHGVQQ